MTADGETWNYDTDGNLQDQRLGEVFDAVPGKSGSLENAQSLLLVADVSIEEGLLLTIRLTGGYQIRVFPDGTQDEAWRFFAPDDTDPHVVVVGDRLI